MTQLLKAKASKLKLQGLEKLLEMLTDDPNNQELSQVSISGLLKETIPANQEKSLQCLKAWISNQKNWG